MDAQRIADITAALQDLLGPWVAVTLNDGGWDIPDGNNPGYFCYLDHDGGLYVYSGTIPADTLDKLHAASQIVRGMNHA